MKTSAKLAVFFLALLTATASLRAADVTIGNGQTVKYSETTDFTATSNISGPTAAGEKGTFTMDIATDTFNGTRYKGKITGNLDVYKTGGKNWRMYNANSDYVGTTYLQGGNLYLTTGSELGKSTIKWSSGQIVNEGNEGVLNCVIKQDSTTFKAVTLQNAGANAVVIGGDSSSFTVNSGMTTTLTNSGAGTLTLSSKTIKNSGTLNLTNSGAGSLVFQGISLAGTVNLANTGTGSVSVTAITVSQNTLEFQNSSTGDAHITSKITVNSGKDVHSARPTPRTKTVPGRFTSTERSPARTRS